MNKLIRYYDFFRYDLLRFVKNFWRFRKDLYYFRTDIAQNHFLFLRTSLMQALKMHKENYIEENAIQSKIIEKIERAIYLLDVMIDDAYIDEAEKKLGYSYSSENNTPEQNMKFMKTVIFLEEQYNEELFRILKGQNVFEQLPDEWGIGFPSNYDGTGIKHWGD